MKIDRILTGPGLCSNGWITKIFEFSEPSIFMKILTQNNFHINFENMNFQVLGFIEQCSEELFNDFVQLCVNFDVKFCVILCYF